ncbi:hypothetical protein M9H77_07637 [Catharanthus roseus]|uniref:Uncharacterized protein n=1 Tax=Catharanthus roseus TaxID=4058 RepID=A0ACC0BVH7_CATRO|nr:hypothetical protein M9H77_07637 [Catharanthus roseus]
MNMYVQLFGSLERVYELIKKTNWEERSAPYEHWMDTPNHFYVIANKFNFYVLQLRDGCPLPPMQFQWQYHRDVRVISNLPHLVRCPSNLISCHHIYDQHPASSFASTRDACPRFLYKYASVAVPHENFPADLTSFTSGQSLEGTMLPLLSLNSEQPNKY